MKQVEKLEMNDIKQELKNEFNANIDLAEAMVVLIFRKDLKPGVGFFGEIEKISLLKDVFHLRVMEAYKESLGDEH